MQAFVLTVVFLSSASLVYGVATDVRLVHGTVTGLKDYEGAVEVMVDGKWGPILRHGIDDTTAKTICKILGYGFVGFHVQRFSYSGTPLLNNLTCSGSETSIARCHQEPSTFQSVFYDAPGIHCFDHVFTDIRIVSNTIVNSGTIQVKMDERWGLVCDYNSVFGVMPAPNIDKVVCRQLGYETSDQTPIRGESHGLELSWIDLDMTSCNGSESKFNECTFRPMTIYQPGCYAIRAVTCITLLNGSCISDAICAAIPHAVCRKGTCVCEDTYKETYNGQCVNS